MANELMLHRGANKVERPVLEMVPMPEQTDTYQPVGHHQLTDSILEISQDILTDYALIGEDYALARDGDQLFAVLKYQHPEVEEMALTIGYRNSYDKSMSVGLAMGAQVFVCDNMALNGDIVVMRKHTSNVWASLEEMAVTAIYQSTSHFYDMIDDASLLKGRELNDGRAFQRMGVLFGQGILGSRQLTVVKDQWLKPKHEEFQPRNEWSFYNACTEALKSSPPATVMEQHTKLHNYLCRP